MMTEYFGTGTKKVRGRQQRSLDLIQTMYDIAEESQPITGRGIGYKLFSLNLIPSMDKKAMKSVYRGPDEEPKAAINRMLAMPFDDKKKKHLTDIRRFIKNVCFTISATMTEITVL